MNINNTDGLELNQRLNTPGPDSTVPPTNGGVEPRNVAVRDATD